MCAYVTSSHIQEQTRTIAVIPSLIILLLDNNKRICIAQVCRMTSEALIG